MTRFVLEKKGGPAYRQLYAQLKDAIAAGIYPPGSKLPSKRALAAELGVSVITAEHALALLADEGWVEPRERSGVFVLGRGAAAPVRRAALEEMSLPTSVPEDFPFSVLARIMRRTLAEKGERILAKSPPLGTLELRGAIRADGVRTGRPVADLVDALDGFHGIPLAESFRHPSERE